MGKDDYSTGLPGEVDDPRPDLLEQLINNMYCAEGESDDLEFISHTDLLESIRGVISKAHSSAVYDMMLKIGYHSKTIEGTVYWLVYSA